MRCKAACLLHSAGNPAAQSWAAPTLAASTANAESPRVRSPEAPPWTPPDDWLDAHLPELGRAAQKLGELQTVLAGARLMAIMWRDFPHGGPGLFRGKHESPPEGS